MYIESIFNRDDLATKLTSAQSGKIAGSITRERGGSQFQDSPFIPQKKDLLTRSRKERGQIVELDSSTFQLHGPRLNNCRLAFKYGVVKCSRFVKNRCSLAPTIFTNISVIYWKLCDRRCLERSRCFYVCCRCCCRLVSKNDGSVVPSEQNFMNEFLGYTYAPKNSMLINYA